VFIYFWHQSKLFGFTIFLCLPFRCAKLCHQYNYSVEYGGVGEPPPGSEYLGYCSQSAMFVRQTAYQSPEEGSVGDTYRLVNCM